jgi:hypothetical protein
VVVCVNYVWFSVRTKEELVFCFRSSTNKQQQRFFSIENHLFRINLGGCLCLNSVWFSVSIIEELVCLDLEDFPHRILLSAFQFFNHQEEEEEEDPF